MSDPEEVHRAFLDKARAALDAAKAIQADVDALGVGQSNAAPTPLSPVTVACAISALRVVHDSLDQPSIHFSVEVQQQHQAEIVAALAELLALPPAPTAARPSQEENEEAMQLLFSEGAFMPKPNPPEPLWSSKRIVDEAIAICQYWDNVDLKWVRNAIFVAKRSDVLDLVERMQADYEAERAALRAQLATPAVFSALPAGSDPPSSLVSGQTLKVLDAMDRVLDRLVSLFGDDANTMPAQLLEDYLTTRAWLDEQPRHEWQRAAERGAGFGVS